MPVDDAFHDAQPQSGSTFNRRVCFCNAKEAIEHFGNRVIGNTDSRVNDLGDHVSADHLVPNSSRVTRPTVLDRVLNQIVEDAS